MAIIGKKNNLLGKRFGKLVVVEEAPCTDGKHRRWYCDCDCGNKHISIIGDSLTSGKTKSCGCKHIDVGRGRRTLHIGDVFGNLTVLEYTGKGYLCKCTCGAEHIYPVKRIKTGRACIDCTPTKYACKDLTNKRFGKLVAKAPTSKRYGNNIIWHCICDCGNEVGIPTNRLVSGNTRSCGCLSQDTYKLKRNYSIEFINLLATKEDKARASVGALLASESVDFVCPIHGVYNQRVYDKWDNDLGIIKRGCPKCSNSLAHIGTKHELEILEFFNQLVHDTVKAPSILEGKEIDIFSPSLSIGIEYNGSAYHATEGAIYRNLDKYYHQQKFLLAKEKGINLITVFDIDYENNRELVLDTIKDTALNSYTPFIPTKEVEYTNNDFGDGSWMKRFGYKEVGQEEPQYFIYQNRFKVYRCGRTIWKYAF